MLRKIVVSRLRPHGGGGIQIQRPERRIQNVTNPVTDDTTPEMHPTAPVPGQPERGVRAELHRAHPEIVIESFGNLMRLVHFGQVGDLAIDILERIAAGMDGVNLANGSGPNPLANPANATAGMTLVSELTDHLVLVGRRRELSNFIHRLSQRLLTLDVLAVPHA